MRVPSSSTAAGPDEFCATALRSSGYGERRLTEAMGRMLGDDQAAAGTFARTLTSLFRSVAPLPPSKLRCNPETGFYGGVWSKDRRADLLFRSEQHKYALLVECKLHAALGYKQVADSIKARRRSFEPPITRGTRIYVALLATKALVPHDKTTSKRWLGAATWAELLDELMRLRFASDELGQRWRGLLSHYRRGGAFDTEPRRGDDDNTLNALAFPVARDADRVWSKRGGSVSALRWDPGTEAVVRQRRHGAAMRLEISDGRARRMVEVRLESRPERGGNSHVVITERTAGLSQERVSAPAAGTFEQLRDQLAHELAPSAVRRWFRA